MIIEDSMNYQVHINYKVHMNYKVDSNEIKEKEKTGQQ